MPSTPLKTLSAGSVNQIAHILQTLPHERGLEYGERVNSTLACLAHELKQGSRLSNLLSANAPPSNIQARLCLLHKPLSASLIHEIFTLLSLEVGHHSNSLIEHNTWLSPAQLTALQQLRELHSLWLPGRTYEQTFLAAPNPQWPHQKSGCEGCILTRIGSDLLIVSRLRALLLSRQRTVKPKKGHPRLLAFVDAWVVGLVGKEERHKEVIQASEMEAEELKIVRKQIWRGRREKTKSRRTALAAENVRGALHDGEKQVESEGEMMEQEAYDSDFENEIIDHYKALRSTLPQSSAIASPAKLASLPTSTPAQTPSFPIETRETPHPPRSSQVQASSRYSRKQSSEATSYEPPRRGKAWREQTSAGKQAQEYRALLTPPPEDSLLASNAPAKEERGQKPRKHGTLLTPPPDEGSPRPRAGVREEKRQKPRENRHPLMPHPEEPSPRRKAAEKEPLPASRSERDDKKRETTWSQFCQ